MVICDNTFLTPSLLQPLTLKTNEEGAAVAADVVIHSAATFFSGHNDSVGGMIVTRDIGLAEQIRRARSVYGGILSPYHCFLMMRGIATLSARMRVHSENAMAVAKFLSQHSAVASVHYPGLLTDPGHPTSARLLSAGPGRGRLYGAMLGFTLHGGVEEIKRFAAHLSLCKPAPAQLGGVHSQVNEIRALVIVIRVLTIVIMVPMIAILVLIIAIRPPRSLEALSGRTAASIGR